MLTSNANRSLHAGQNHRRATTARIATGRGFTLVELLIVIVVIGMLMALLLPALQTVFTRTRQAAVRTEISQLESAIAQFKQTFGVEPPSSINLCANSVDWQLAANAPSMAYIRRIWPQMDFTQASTNYPWTNAVHTLNGAECLMFFLGGVYPAAGTYPIGFSKNPANPFNNTPGGSRDGPFIEFDAARIVDNFPIGGPPNHFPEYMDSFSGQTMPYFYFSGYDGQGYLASDVALLTLANPTFGDVYRIYTAIGTGPVPGAATSSLPAYKPQSFQIISPGPDGADGATGYGSGGAFNPKGNNSSLYSTYDFDNLTNFNAGVLKP